MDILNEARLITCCREEQFMYSRAVSETIEAYTRALAKISKHKKNSAPRMMLKPS
jgi:hypothetical protein